MLLLFIFALPIIQLILPYNISCIFDIPLLSLDDAYIYHLPPRLWDITTNAFVIVQTSHYYPWMMHTFATQTPGYNHKWAAVNLWKTFYNPPVPEVISAWIHRNVRLVCRTMDRNTDLPIADQSTSDIARYCKLLLENPNVDYLILF